MIDAADRELAMLSKRIEKQMARVEREIHKAERDLGREAAKLLHQARGKLDMMQVRGSSEWVKFLRESKRDLSKTLGKVERVIRPKPAAKKKTAKKKSAKKKTTRKKAS